VPIIGFDLPAGFEVNDALEPEMHEKKQ